ncbi:pyridoxamine 5'-phosphate oxidase family protein [Caulobacter segnis]|uniref:pyridoxamine 5'-phosphate oxidase family protein n=1 Tax=Caulobacter segnis TaxID=88688 RepID=UPI00240F55BC|nr:pyridoxamine 5'-phosphate oxidase family protein [Caulobacter segnis]MDG2520627.1 pyridoxamine 5'-phosphate oxidase family protein [Caulobacter segnis]
MKERQDDNPAPPQEVRDRIWELAEKIDIGMFTTWDGERQHSRPLSARVRRDEHAIYFLVDVAGEKNAQIERFPAASCAWADNANYKYVLISGQAALSNDRAKITELWTKADEAWWEDDSDPTIRLLKLTPEQGELWDSPGKAVALVKMIAAAVTGGAPQMGDNAKVEL